VSADPFQVLGLSEEASADEIRAARRALAKQHHPDRGGEAGRMRDVNAAAAAALRRVADRGVPASPPAGPAGGGAGARPEGAAREPRWSGSRSDLPSFTVEALPAETFEALLVVASWLGEVLDDDPPYRLDAVLAEPTSCWCRLELLPDAGASTVGLTVAPLAPTRAAPPVEVVRDRWIDGLNRLDWA
jgi:hypothetical protein